MIDEDIPFHGFDQVNNDAVVDEVVANVQATDGDAFAPGNIVKYRLITEESSERAGVYFRVDTDSGDIILQGRDGNRIFHVSCFNCLRGVAISTVN